MAEPERLRPRGEPIRPGPRQESVVDSAKELISDIGDLLRLEIQLARQEIQSDISRLLQGAIWLSIGLTAAFLGVVSLLLAAVFALGTVTGLGTAALIIGVIVLVIGGILTWAGVNMLKSARLVPNRTVQSLREDAEWMRNRMR